MITGPDHTGLPIEEAMPALRAALARGSSAVLTAEPGAGKTTVIPLRLLAEPWATGTIVVLEPRRIATRAAARRMSALLGEPVGGTVGYRTRDEAVVSSATRVEVVTEGILTRRLQAGRILSGVSAVVFDEFHERNLQGDLGLALALSVQRLDRPDLRLLVMSATLDTGRIAAHLGGAPVITSPGRQHPVHIKWAPKRKQDRLEDAVANVVQRAVREENGDVLVFLPGAAEIRRVEQRLRDSRVGSDLDIRPLFGGLRAAEQDAALEPASAGARRVVLATDIAESSLTVEGVRVVVDAGLARVPRFDPATAVTRLTTVAASRSSVDQRAGRAGRVEPGVAYRLWSKLEQGVRKPHLEPEIRSVDLAGLALELAVWGAAPDELPFLDPPPPRAVADARALLVTLGALDGSGAVTPAGHAMARLPLHPRLARMVADPSAPDGTPHPGDPWLACLIAALVEERDVLRGRPQDVPADLDLRLRLLDDPTLVHPLRDVRAVQRTREAALDLARRTGAEPGRFAFDRAGGLAALAYPDRVGERRTGSAGRFRLAGGRVGFVEPGDLLVRAERVVVLHLDGKGTEGRIRLAAAFPEV